MKGRQEADYRTFNWLSVYSLQLAIVHYPPFFGYPTSAELRKGSAKKTLSKRIDLAKPKRGAPDCNNPAIEERVDLIFLN